VPTTLPHFAQGGGIDAIAEFVAFQAAAAEPAAEVLALLTWIRAFGLDHIPTTHPVGPQGLYCHQQAGWGVFYVGSGARSGECRIVVLAVFDIETQAYGELVNEAQRRRMVLGI
jgi:hypothetical protein